LQNAVARFPELHLFPGDQEAGPSAMPCTDDAVGALVLEGHTRRRCQGLLSPPVVDPDIPLYFDEPDHAGSSSSDDVQSVPFPDLTVDPNEMRRLGVWLFGNMRRR